MENQINKGQFKCPHCIDEPRFALFVHLFMHIGYEHGIRSIRRDRVFDYLAFDMEDFLDVFFIDVYKAINK